MEDISECFLSCSLKIVSAHPILSSSIREEKSSLDLTFSLFWFPGHPTSLGSLCIWAFPHFCYTAVFQDIEPSKPLHTADTQQFVCEHHGDVSTKGEPRGSGRGITARNNQHSEWYWGGLTQERKENEVVSNPGGKQRDNLFSLVDACTHFFF